MARKHLIISLVLALFSSVMVAHRREYLVTVKTQGKRFAGTDSRVFITMYGPKGNFGELELNNSLTHKNDPFEKNHFDEFKFDLINFGSVFKIKLRHLQDPFDAFPGWDVEYVTISSPDRPWETSRFDCHVHMNNNKKVFIKSFCGYDVNEEAIQTSDEE